MEQTITKTNEDFLYLITCSLHNKKPSKEKVCGMNFEEIIKFATFHDVAAITYDALELIEDYIKDKQHEIIKDEILVKWKELRDKALCKNLMLDSFRKKLFSYMDRESIWHMSLKGVVLKELYPKQEMRQMADNDILFDATYSKKINKFFVENGYEIISYNKGNHDIYEKKPVFNFEMHTSLFGKSCNEVWIKYYENIEEKLIKDENTFERFFTDDDFYIYFVAHAFKHFNSSGTGIRYFVDCYVYQNCKKLNWEYVENELEKLGILEFEKLLRGVSYKIFGQMESVNKLNEDEYKLLCESIYSGTYGTMINRIEKKLHRVQGDDLEINKRTKAKYLFRRFFPPMSFYKEFAPFAYKTKILIPFYWMYRIIRGATFKRKVLYDEAKMVQKLSK